ncbi:GNAT family N-acetyltransferase [Agrobacterium fabrum]|uniref:GNAT family N-acetyltransferase n=2 Tax=Agrobacterium fabrum TaxID=1176649 RepID=UPI001573C952|nr:GNAT family N-acetyltransferase [Agrobacterium fabrum]WIE44891.1 GNAT family N-acetyltransferase [Agrobacterium fabrum]
METDLRIAGIAKKPKVREMLSVYLRELSQYGDVDYEYSFLDSYWVDQDRWPYIISAGKETAGIALINTWSPSGKGTDFAVAEFYVRPEFRGSGIGTRAFSTVLSNRPGTWELSVMSKNQAGKAFWEKALAKAAVSKIERIDLHGESAYRFSYKR